MRDGCGTRDGTRDRRLRDWTTDWHVCGLPAGAFETALQREPRRELLNDFFMQEVLPLESSSKPLYFIDDHGVP